MPETGTTEPTGQKIKEMISTLTAAPNMCGFEVFVITKSDPRLKKMGFIESGENNLRQKLKDSILKILSEKYNSAEADYVSADRIADEQRKFYIIPTSESYDPLSVLKTDPGAFSKNDIRSAEKAEAYINEFNKKRGEWNNVQNDQKPAVHDEIRWFG